MLNTMIEGKCNILDGPTHLDKQIIDMEEKSAHF